MVTKFQFIDIFLDEIQITQNEKKIRNFEIASQCPNLWYFGIIKLDSLRSISNKYYKET